MKTIIIVRHAKSSWAEPGIDDFDRPLNDRGKKDAPEMAQRLLKKINNIDLFISSPAKRAKKTAQLFAEEFGYKKENIQVAPELYLPASTNFYRVINKIAATFNSIIIFSHNPGITEFTNTLTNVKIDDMPTCAFFAVRCNCNSWSEFSLAEKEFLFFDYPKSL